MLARVAAEKEEEEDIIDTALDARVDFRCADDMTRHLHDTMLSMVRLGNPRIICCEDVRLLARSVVELRRDPVRFVARRPLLPYPTARAFAFAFSFRNSLWHELGRGDDPRDEGVLRLHRPSCRKFPLLGSGVRLVEGA